MNKKLRDELSEKGWGVGNILCLILGTIMIIWFTGLFRKIFGGFGVAMGLTYILYFFTKNRTIEAICILLGPAAVIVGIILFFVK